MEEIKETDKFDIDTINFPNYSLTFINSKYKHNSVQQFGHNKCSVISIECINELQDYSPGNLYYFLIESNGLVINEYKGDYSTFGHQHLFKNPNNEFWNETITYSQYNSRNRWLYYEPFFNKNKIEIEIKLDGLISGNKVGCINNKTISFTRNIDLSGTNEVKDVISFLKFHNENDLELEKIEVDLPGQNDCFLDGNMINLIFEQEKKTILHRILDENGREINRRSINLSDCEKFAVIKLSFTNNSYLIGYKNEEMFLMTISNEGVVSRELLFIAQDKIKWLGHATKIGNTSYVVAFNTKKGIGWFSIIDNKLIECFYSINTYNYSDSVSGETIVLENYKYTISGCNKTIENGYMLSFQIFYKASLVPNNKLILLNRQIKKS